MSKLLEHFANASVLVVALSCGALLIHDRVENSHASRASPPETALVGRSVTDHQLLASPKRTLVIAMSTHCHFCVDSTPFYSTLSRHLLGDNTVALATLMPESKDESYTFLAKHDIHPTLVVSEPLANVGVQGTPTILLLGVDGKVQRAWVGELSPARQKEVLAAL